MTLDILPGLIYALPLLFLLLRIRGGSRSEGQGGYLDCNGNSIKNPTIIYADGKTTLIDDRGRTVWTIEQ